MKKAVRLTEGSPGRRILALTGPMSVGMVGMVVFNLVDTWFVGRLGTDALAAMGFTFPVILLQGSISMGLGIGTSAAVSRAFGRDDHEDARRLTTYSLYLSVLIVILFVVIGLLTIDPLFRAMGADGDRLILVKRYMRIWYLGVPFVVIPMIGNNAIRAAGNTVIPSAIMLTAICVNLILDPLLIFGIGPFPRMGIAGAALATVFARSTTLVVSLLVLRFRFGLLAVKVSGGARLRDSWKRILSIGLPAAATQSVIPLSMGVITRIVSVHGTSAVAALGVGTRVEMFVLSPIRALAAVLVPFVGQNIGAGRADRVKEGLRFGYRFSLSLGALSFVVLLVAGRSIGGLFDPNPEVVRIAALYMAVASAGYGAHGMQLISANSFSALGRPYHAAALNLARMFGLYIPLALLGSRLFGPAGIFAGASLSAFIAGGLGALWVMRSLARPLKEDPESAIGG
jgi:putative MATE family efflux protein